MGILRLNFGQMTKTGRGHRAILALTARFGWLFQRHQRAGAAVGEYHKARMFETVGIRHVEGHVA